MAGARKVRLKVLEDFHHAQIGPASSELVTSAHLFAERSAASSRDTDGVPRSRGRGLRAPIPRRMPGCGNRALFAGTGRFHPGTEEMGGKLMARASFIKPLKIRFH